MEAAMRLFCAQYAHVDAAEMAKAFKKAMKPNKSEVIQSELREVIQNHKKISLTRLRKELAAAYKSVHEKDSDSEGEPKPMRKYNQFFKEQSAILKGEMKNATQVERVEEIGRRWKAQKELEAEMRATEERIETTLEDAMNDIREQRAQAERRILEAAAEEELPEDEPETEMEPVVEKPKRARRASNAATPSRASKRVRS